MKAGNEHVNCGCEQNSGNPAICFRGVSFSYGNSLVIEDADFDLYQGESVCVVGPNGGGKSTLLKLMLGLLKPDAGSVSLLGSRPESSRRRVGYVPQLVDVDPLFPVSVLEVVLMGCLHAWSFGFARRKDKKRALDMLEQMGLAGRAHDLFSALSGGQRQAVLIARALAAKIDVLLLDEPTAHVDVAAEARLLDRLKAFNERLTLITVSHDLAFVTRSVPKVVCVNRCVHVHPTKELTNERLQQLYGSEVRIVQHAHEHLDSHGGHRHD